MNGMGKRLVLVALSAAMAGCQPALTSAPTATAPATGYSVQAVSGTQSCMPRPYAVFALGRYLIKADASLSTTLTREKQQRSTLEQQLDVLLSTYIDAATGTYWRTNGTLLSQVDELVPDFYQRATDDATNFTNAANLTWRPLSWLTTSADGGINVINRSDEVLLPRGMVFTADSIGRMNTGHGTTVVSTVNLRSTATAPLPWGFHLQLAFGGNYTRTSLSTGWSRSPSSRAGRCWNAAATSAWGTADWMPAAIEPRAVASGWNSLPMRWSAFAIEMTTLPSRCSDTDSAVAAAESHGVATTITSARAASALPPPRRCSSENRAVRRASASLALTGKVS